MSSPEIIHQEVIACGRLLLARGLLWGRSGNISHRTGRDTFLISASGTDLGALTAADLVACRVSSAAYEGSIPSRETGLHRAIYRSQPGVQAVVHASPFYSSLVACCHVPLRTDLFPEAMAYLQHVAWVPYCHPGSQALAEAVAAQARESDVLILENHGAVALGQSLEEVVLRLETLEFLSRMEVTARASGLTLRYLGEKVALAFAARYQAHQAPEQEVSRCRD